MGLFALVSHTHLPYVKRNGVWPVGEDHFHQAASESYLPLLEMIEHLGNDGFEDAFTLGLSPMIATQMADPYMLDELGWYLGRFELRAMQTISNYGIKEHPDDPDPLHVDEVKDLAAWNTVWARDRLAHLESVRSNYGDLCTAFASMSNVVELLGGPATHPLMPRIEDSKLASLQLSLGMQESQRLTGQRPPGIWLPECHFAPDRGLDDLFTRESVSHLVLDGPTIIRAVDKQATFQPWIIKGSSTVAFGRDLDVTYRVWSPTGGYPSGAWYRDFHHYDMQGGFKNWRVTGRTKPLAEKRPYEPQAAAEACRKDAEDFVAALVRRLSEYENDGNEGLVVAAYDTELFGHWWFEGPIFLEHVLRFLADSPVRPVSLRKALDLLPEPSPVVLQEGSWGFRKDLRSWVTEETQPMLEALSKAEREVAADLRTASVESSPARDSAKTQMLRELLLLQASDWPFKIVRGKNPGYAWQRFNGHLQRIGKLRELVRSRLPEDLLMHEVAKIQDVDDVFPNLTLAAL